MFSVKILIIFFILFYAWNASAIDFQACQNCSSAEMRTTASRLLPANGAIIIYDATNHTSIKFHSFTTRKPGLKRKHIFINNLTIKESAFLDSLYILYDQRGPTYRVAEMTIDLSDQFPFQNTTAYQAFLTSSTQYSLVQFLKNNQVSFFASNPTANRLYQLISNAIENNYHIDMSVKSILKFSNLSQVVYVINTESNGRPVFSKNDPDNRDGNGNKIIYYNDARLVGIYKFETAAQSTAFVNNLVFYGVKGASEMATRIKRNPTTIVETIECKQSSSGEYYCDD